MGKSRTGAGGDTPAPVSLADAQDAAETEDVMGKATNWTPMLHEKETEITMVVKEAERILTRSFPAIDWKVFRASVKRQLLQEGGPDGTTGTTR